VRYGTDVKKEGGENFVAVSTAPILFQNLMNFCHPNLANWHPGLALVFDLSYT
jgi:hypothetical protein